MIITVDNFQGLLDASLTKSKLKKLPASMDYKGYLSSSKMTVKPIHVTLGDYKKVLSESNYLFDMLGEVDKRDADDLICSVSQVSKNGGLSFVAQTGNYVGKFIWDKLEIDIRSRFPNVLMKRMLNVANDVFLDDVDSFDAEVSKDLDFSKFIIYYMFILKLEKAFLLGLPKAYRSVQHHDMKLKGKIDINRFIKRDMPFQGKISSVSREQHEIQGIVDVLHKAVQVIGKNLTQKITPIKAHLKQHRSNQFVSSATIQKAMSSKALQNPIFAPYKSVLEYAKLIIDGSNLEEKANGKEKTFGFLVNVAELFEIYVTKLLQKEFPDWHVSSPKIELYKPQFYARKIIPDIVMKHYESGKVMVFDTKYKRMKQGGKNQYGAGDVDRNDFFQINTYMTYYQQQGERLIAGGLLYPMESPFESKKCHSDHWLGNEAVKFVVDGIDLAGLDKAGEDEKALMECIVEGEQGFVKRVRMLCLS